MSVSTQSAMKRIDEIYSKTQLMGKGPYLIDFITVRCFGEGQVLAKDNNMELVSSLRIADGNLLELLIGL